MKQFSQTQHLIARFGLFCSLFLTSLSFTQAAETARIKTINEIIQKEYKQLGSITNILEYLGQALNKGTITVPNILFAREWIKYHIECVKTIEKELSTPLTEVQLDLETHLYTITLQIQKMADHVAYQLDGRLQQLKLFKAGMSTQEKTPELSDIESLVSQTDVVIERCKIVANETGLSTLNIIARRLDDLNYRYKILPRLFTAAAISVITVGIIYALPDKLLPSSESRFGFLHTLKKSLGERPKTKDEKAVTDEEYDRLGVFGKLEYMWQKKSTQDIIAGLGFMGSCILGRELHDSYDNLQSALAHKWEKLKGFTVKDSESNFRIIEDLTLDDERIIGFDSEKEILNQLADYVIDPEMYDRSNSNPAKSILLIGDSGCGKTLLAQALSGTTNKKMKEKGKEGKFGFIELKWSEIVYSKDGIKTAIEKLKKNAPCFGFVDELHLFPLQTNGSGYSETLAQFLTHLSGLNSENDTKHQVIVIAATNRPDLLDQALLRTGRFGDIVIRCSKPNYEQRKRYFEVMFKRNTIDSSRIDIDALTRQTEHATYSDLDAVVKNARFTARTMAQGVSQKHLQEKIDTLVRRIKKDIPYTQAEKKIIACHLAGHALLYSLPETQPTHKKLETVTIYATARKIKETRVWDAKKDRDEYPRKKVNYGALFTYHTGEMLQMQTHQDQLKLCKIKLAGSLAEKILLGTTGSYRPNDRLNALQIIKSTLLRGIPEAELSKTKREELTDQAYKLLEQYEAETEEFLKKHAGLLTQLAEQLEQKYILSATQIEAIIK